MYQLSAEHREDLVKLHLKAYQKAIDLTPAVIEVLKRFDGKQINKRIDTALKEVNGSLSFTAQYNSVMVEWWIDNRYIRNADGCSVTYIEDSKVTIAHGCANYGGNLEQSCIVDGKLNASALIDSAIAYSTEHGKEIDATLKQLKQVDKLQARQAKIKADIENHNNELQWMVRRYFELDIKR